MFITDMSNAIKKDRLYDPNPSETSQSNLKSNTEEGLFCSTVASTAQYFGAEFTRVIIQSENGEAYKVLAQYRSPDSNLHPPPLPDMKSPTTHYLGEAFRYNQLVMTSLKEYKRGVAFVPETDAIVISIPVIWKGKIVGVFEAIFEGQEVESDKMEAMVALAQLSGSALHDYTRKFEPSDLRNMLLLMVNHSKSAILLEDPNDKILLVNRTFCRALGPDIEPGELTGRLSHDLAEEFKQIFTDPKEFAERVVELKATTEPVIDEKITLKSGRIYSRDYIPVMRNGKRVANFWQYNDITEQELEYQKSEQLLRMERKYNELNQNILSITSHELRNPLANILTNIELVYNAVEKGELEKFNKRMKRIERSADEIKRLLDDIISLGKLEYESHSEQLNVESISGNDILNIVESIRMDLAPNRKICSKPPANSDEIHLQTDPQLFTIILRNIFSNADKYSPVGKPIEFFIDIDQTEVKISVRDYGIGIPPDEIKKVTDSFYRASNRGAAKGTGLGLAIVSKTAEMLGGKLEIDSDLGKGTTVSIIFEHGCPESA